MALTHFPHGMYSPFVAGAMSGLAPANSNVFFVDGTNGSDGNDEGREAIT